jgi:hypothetical protein
MNHAVAEALPIAVAPEFSHHATPDAFIGHAHQDAAVAERLGRALCAAEVRAFYAPWSIRPGEPWQRKIDGALSDCAWFIYLVSESSLKSKPVQEELWKAMTNGKTIVPVVWNIDTSGIGIAANHQALDLRNKSADEQDAAIRSLADRIVQQRRAKELRAMLILIGIATLALSAG